MKGNKAAAERLPSWRMIYKNMEKQQQSQAVGKDQVWPADPPKAINPFLQPSTPPPPLEVKEGYWALWFAAGHCPRNEEEGEDEEDTFDLGPTDSDDQPDLFPPDPQENWVCLKRETLLVGDLEMADKIVAPVIYQVVIYPVIYQ